MVWPENTVRKPQIKKKEKEKSTSRDSKIFVWVMCAVESPASEVLNTD